MVSRLPPAHAFAKKAGVDVAQLERVTTPKGEYLAAKVTKKRSQRGGDSRRRLAQRTLHNLLAQEHVLAQAERTLRASGALAGRDARWGDDSAGI